jgi:tRNA (guanine-N7-)-methyltransferase
MGRALKYDIPGEDWRRSVDDLVAHSLEAQFAPDLVPPFPLVVEIGFGRGEFLMELAGKNPGTAFIGVEVSFKRVLKTARRLARTKLRNVRLVDGRGQGVVEAAIPDASVDAFWINFSDPWPKDRHAPRRLFQPPFVADVARALAPGGRLHVATDDAAYALQIQCLLAQEPRLANRFAPDPWRGEVEGRIRTHYEEDWRAEGRPLHFFEYERAQRP